MPQASGQEENQVELRFVAFPKSTDIAPLELLTGEGKSVEVELFTNCLSKPYLVPAQQKWALGKSGVDASGEPNFEVFGQTASIASDKQIILVIRKGANNSDGLTLIPLDNRAAGFGGGEYLFMNAARVSIGGILGDKKFALKPGEHRIISPKPSEVRGNQSLSYVKIFFENRDDGATPFFTSEWRFNKRVRSMVFIYHDPSGGSLRLHVIRDAT